jgi:hypothetical protein
MKAYLLIILLLFLATSVKAMVPLVPADSGEAVLVGDTIDGYAHSPVSRPPCYILIPLSKYSDNFTITNKNQTDFYYWCEMGQLFHPVFTPTSVGIHRDTVRFQVTYHPGGQTSCKGTSWDSGPIPVVYHAIPDTMPYFRPRYLYSVEMHYDEIHRRYISAQKYGFQYHNNSPNGVNFINSVITDSSEFPKHISVAVDSFNNGTVVLMNNYGKLIGMTSFITDTMTPVNKDSYVPFTFSCHIINSVLDTIYLIPGNLYFKKVDSGMAVVVGDTVKAGYIVTMPCPPPNEDSVTYHHNNLSNFHYHFEDQTIFPTYTPKKIGLYRDTLYGEVKYPDESECSGEPKRFGPVNLVYHGIQGPICDIIPRKLTTLDVDYDEATHRYSRGKRYALRFRSYFDKPTTFTCRILYDANIFPHQISPSFDTLMTSAFTLPANFGQFSVPMGITTDQMGPLLNDVSLKFTLVCNIKNSKFDTTILIQGGQLLFHHLDSGKAIPIGDIIVENDTLNLPFFIYSGDTVRFNNQDTENFGYVFLHDEGMVVANFTPHALGLFHDTLYIDYTDEFLSRQHSGPIPVVFHATPASSSVTSSMKELFPTPTIKVYDSKLSITINVQEPSLITLSISDITGRTIDRIASDKIFQPGMHEIEYTPHSMSSGQYFLSYSTKDGVKVVPFSYIR